MKGHISRRNGRNMNLIPPMECTGTTKISNKLVIGYLPKNSLQFCTQATRSLSSI